MVVRLIFHGEHDSQVQLVGNFQVLKLSQPISRKSIFLYKHISYNSTNIDRSQIPSTLVNFWLNFILFEKLYLKMKVERRMFTENLLIYIRTPYGKIQNKWFNHVKSRYVTNPLSMVQHQTIRMREMKRNDCNLFPKFELILYFW